MSMMACVSEGVLCVVCLSGCVRGMLASLGRLTGTGEILNHYLEYYLSLVLMRSAACERVC